MPTGQKEEFEKAREHLRDTAKWILSTFAVVAGALLAGLQLTSLGKAAGPHLIVAAGAFLVALSAVMGIILRTVNVVVSTSVNEETVQDYQEKRKTEEIDLDSKLLLDGYEKAKDFLRAYRTKCEDYEVAKKEHNAAAVKKLEPDVKKLIGTWTNFGPVASYAFTRRSFKKAVRGLVVLSPIAGVAIFFFAWATSQQEMKTHPIFQSPPSPASVTLTSFGKKALKAGLGERCVEQGSIPVILLSVQDGKFEVVTTPSVACKVAKFTVGMDVASVRSSP